MSAMPRTIQSSIRTLLLPGLFIVALVILARFQFFKSGGAPTNMQNSKPVMAESANEVVLACPGRVEGLTEVIDVVAGVDGVLTESTTSDICSRGAMRKRSGTSINF